MSKLKVHITKCQDIWNQAQASLPSCERISCPEAPADYEQLLSGKGIPKDRLKKMQNEIYERIPLQVHASLEAVSESQYSSTIPFRFFENNSQVGNDSL